MTKEAVPICVDLDGTLVKTDLLFESIIQLLKRKPFFLFALLIWRLKGKAYLKSKIASLIPICTEFLPYNAKVVQFLRKAKQNNHLIFLATGSPKAYADQVAKHLGLFENTFSTEMGINLTRENKMRSLVHEFGEKGFVYIGNSRDDVPIWRAAHSAYFVNTPHSIQNQVKRFMTQTSVIDERAISLQSIVKQLRIYQWVKNALLFIPMITSHSWTGAFDVFLAFFSFSFLSSVIYIVNDLFDLEADRQHPTKKNRPLASGELSIQFGLALAFVLVLMSFSLTYFLPKSFIGILFFYFIINISYNTVFKMKPIIDVLSLSMLYLLRVLGGHAVTGIPLSSWLTTFALFFFLSLALIKRYTECDTKESMKGRGYGPSDVTFISTLGIASNAISILVFALYLNTEQVAKTYQSPEYLWVSIPLLFYWINRLWLKAFRRQMDDDPVVFAIRDRISHYVAILLGLAILSAYYL